MRIETITAESRPMLYVTRSANVEPKDIADVMGEAFGTMDTFFGRSGVRPAGRPLAVYHDWDKGSGKMKVDLGFPVAASDTPKATGEVHAGRTPAGQALKAVHRGPYPKLQETYSELEGHLLKAGIPTPSTAWEIYVSDPGKTPPDELLTEVYMPL